MSALSSIHIVSIWYIECTLPFFTVGKTKYSCMESLIKIILVFKRYIISIFRNIFREFVLKNISQLQIL